MTKERFISIQSRRGYSVKDCGNMVILTMGNYTALWFFKEDGSLDENNLPTWTISNGKR